MKMRKAFWVFILLGTISCSSVKKMQVNVQKPILVQLPADVKRMVIVDRTQGNFLSAIEGILTGEMIGIDKTLVQECINGLSNPFLRNSKIQITRHAERLKSEQGTSTGFGTVMSANQVSQIAKLHQADALLVLEYFDSDFSIRNISSPNNTGQVSFQGHAKAKVGIRIYLPKTQSLFYENGFTYSKNYGETATNKNQLLGKLITGTNALKFVSYELGLFAGRRFVSYRIWEDREIMKGKTDATKRAQRLIIAQDYNNAISTLDNAFKDERKPKNKARIAHNLGFCYEVQGDLQASKRWLTESYMLSGNKKTKRYLNTINRRIAEDILIDRQKN